LQALYLWSGLPANLDERNRNGTLSPKVDRQSKADFGLTNEGLLVAPVSSEAMIVFPSISRTVKILIFISWCLLLYPLTFLGYGSDEDAWLVARTAHRIWSSGHYVISRTIGFPLYEILITPLVHFGSWYLSNVFSLACGAVLLLALYRLADHDEFRHPVLSAIALSFLPIITKNAASTMDYIAALAVLIWAYVFMLQKKWLLSATLIGVACGFRPTSGIFLIPLLVFAYKEVVNSRIIFRIILLTLLVAILTYSPVLIYYGLRRPYSSIPLSLATRILMGGYNAFTVFGIAQSVFVVAVLTYLLYNQTKNSSGYIQTTHFEFHAINIAVWLFLFLLLPDEPEYLMPLVPSVIFLIDRLASKRLFSAVTVVLLLYHLIQLDLLGGESGNRKLTLSVRPGYTIADIQHRIFQLSLRSAATHYHAKQPTVFMMGYTYIPIENEGWVFDTRYEMFRQTNGKLYVSKRINDENKMRELRREGFKLIVWRAYKWEYVRSGNSFWLKYVDVIDDLSAFFLTPITGKSLTER
jgi:hypothetical protein